MLNFCDVVVLTLNEPAEWLERCLASLDHPQLHVHVRAGIENDLGNARADNIFVGENSFVMFADPDDVYDAQVIVEMLELFNRKPSVDVMYSGEFVFNEQKNKKQYLFTLYSYRKHFKSAVTVHGVTIFRRAALLPGYVDVIRQFKRTYEQWALTLFMSHKGHGFYGYDRPGRLWYQHGEQTSKKATPEDRKAFRAFLRSMEV